MNKHLPSQSWNLDDRMTVVLFAGMGGGCDGLEDAGFHVHLAVNHDPLAIAVHETRHPHTTHLRCDVFEVDPKNATKGRRVRNLHASPDCTHFSVAKGSKPVSKRRRSLAWVIPRWCGTVRPEVVTLENVREITTWGPLIAKRDKATGRVLRLDGSVAAKGERVPVAEQWLIPDPRHKGRIWRAWLKHMHSLRYSFEFKNLCCADYGVPTIRTRLFGVGRADGGVIHWPSRTHAPRDKAKALGLKPWVGANTIIDWSLPMRSIFGRDKELADATKRRIARGVVEKVIEANDPFIVPITHVGDVRVHDINDPLRTLTTAHRGELAVLAPVLAGAGGRAAQTGPRDVREPLSTTSTKEDRILSAVHLAKFSENAVAFDPREPLNTVMAGGQGHALVAATMVQTGYGEREGQAPRVKDIEEPTGTQVAGGGKEAIVSAFLAKHYTGVVGSDIREPMPTLTTGGERGVTQIAPVIATLRGTSKEHDAREPLPAQSAGGGHDMLIMPFLQTYYGSGDNNHDAREPLRTVTVNDRHGIVTVEVDGQTMVITDICMRMLDPLEAARAHGFDPASLQHEIEVTDGRGRKVRRKPNKTEIGHLVGNSVPPRMVQLLAEANCRRELMEAAE
ncbi:DNA cytosine methyltransferase [Paradevosia shaoguanensis]|uniref:DNA cytosine methyltransferase n=1 Tax=Paradevosia shaoguanensis TaxID=1335043 RepID=UPI001932FE0B|nr:DNA cytosine methyltransferase [Paradevosia shaoguanensis]